jgi:zinc protease
LVSELELANEVRGSASATRDPGCTSCGCRRANGRRAEEALRVIEATLADVAEHGVLESELVKAKNRLELGFLHGMESVSGKAEQLGFFETVLGDADLCSHSSRPIARVSTGDLSRLARTASQPAAHHPVRAPLRGRGRRHRRGSMTSCESSSKRAMPCRCVHFQV